MGESLCPSPTSNGVSAVSRYFMTADLLWFPVRVREQARAPARDRPRAELQVEILRMAVPVRVVPAPEFREPAARFPAWAGSAFPPRLPLSEPPAQVSAGAASTEWE